jgi:hypothetical protein
MDLSLTPNGPSPADLRAQLNLLALEREAAKESGLADDPNYMSDLVAEIHAVRAAYVGSAVTEIATLRAGFDGRLHG